MCSDQPGGTPAPGPIEVEAFDPEGGELADWLASVNLVFKHHGAPPDGWVESRVQGYRGHRLLAARDGKQIVGTLRSWDLNLTIPGGSLTAAAISTVTVQPTHTRRGVLTRMMTTDLASTAERGTPVAILVASEATIYGRFGFGPVTSAVDLEVDTLAARLRPGSEQLAAGCRLSVIDDVELRQVGPGVYERSRRPGDIDRNGMFWDQICGLVPTPWPRTPSDVTVLARDGAGEPVGILRYQATEEYEHRVPRGRVEVKLLSAATPAAAAALWGYLLRIDLIRAAKLADFDPDSELPWLLTDARAVQVRSRDDFLWSRVLDPAALLSARRYAGLPGRVVFEVRDPQRWAEGRFALQTGEDGAGRCTRSSEAAELELDVDVLGACWLGNPGLASAAAAGRAAEHIPGALDRLAALLATSRAPWSSTWF